MSIGAAFDKMIADIKQYWKVKRCKHPAIWNVWRDTPGQTGYSHDLDSIRADILTIECPDWGTKRYAFDVREHVERRDRLLAAGLIPKERQ